MQITMIRNQFPARIEARPGADTMKWFRGIFQTSRQDAGLQVLQDKFTHFLVLLEKNNQVLKNIGDLEEKSQGEHLFDMNYIRARVAEVRSGVSEVIARMIALGGESYKPLSERFATIDAEVNGLIQGKRPIRPSDFTIPLDQLSRELTDSVGSKNAQLGELKGIMGLPVPEGFAISAWAYKQFVDTNRLQARITETIDSLEIRKYDDLVEASQAIQALVATSSLPVALVDSIQKSSRELMQRSACQTFSMRSSAIGEDTVFSFAGQYQSFLAVPADDLMDRYRAVLASKFSPQAIYYFLSHELSESELAMSVCCMAMVDAVASGVVYTRDPVNPGDDCVLVSSIYGLGQYLVDGTLTPDFFRISRADGLLLESHLAKKPIRLVALPEGGTAEELVPEADRDTPSLSDRHLKKILDLALKVEAHYGNPQDIEWALDRHGRLFVLQTRSLRVIHVRPSQAPTDSSELEVLLSKGTTVCPGAACGPIVHLASTQDLPSIPEGAVLVAPTPFSGLVTAMRKAKAIVTEVGGVASHMATLAREYRIPTLVGVRHASELASGRVVTVDATGGTIYAGSHPALCAARAPESELFEDTAILSLLVRLLAKISTLNLVHPHDPNFTIENCQTFHDITRFAHQRAMEEMFLRGKNMEHKERFGMRLKSEIPLEVNIIYIDPENGELTDRGWITEEDIASPSMKAFWEGMRKEGWASDTPAPTVGGLISVLATHLATDQEEFLESSFAILSKEYMILSLHLGYHFTTVEAVCTPEPSKNYIRMQHKGGGASLDRRTRRVQLIQDLLSQLGFEHTGKGDFLDSSVPYLDSPGILQTLYLLGRITIVTKQLDIALSNDAITRWYLDDFAKKLGLKSGQ